MKESAAQSAILDYLAAKRVLAIRLNNQPIFDPKRGIFRALPKHTPHGLSDILAIKEGRSYFFEVKSDKGKPSQDQLDFGREAIRAGAAYHIVRSIDDVQNLGL